MKSIFACCVFIILLLRPTEAATSETPKLNVLFIAADDLRCDLACFGNPEVKTPNLDRLAARGRSFTHAYCQQALCNPSRASLMTGLRPDTIGIWNLETHFRENVPDAVTLPQRFKQEGYFTRDIGKIFHNGRTKIQGDPDSWSVPAIMHWANHGDDKAQVNGALPPNLAEDLKCEQRDVPDEAYFDGRVAAEAVKALRELTKSKQPFFLAVGFWKPHSPFNAPKKYWDLYDRAAISLPKFSNPPLNVPKIALHNSQEILGNPPRKLSESAVREIRHGYLANISYLDAQVGRVLEELQRLGLADKTIVVLWGDNGYHLGEQSLWAKTSNFELDANIPLIIAGPGVKQAGQKTGSLVELLDLYPTLLELCGLPTRAKLEGRSLVPLLNDPQAIVKPAAFTQHPRPAYYSQEPKVMGYSVRTEKFRYTEWHDFKTGEIVARELYDHIADPHENVNRADDKEFTDESRRNEQLLAAEFQLHPPPWQRHASLPARKNTQTNTISP